MAKKTIKQNTTRDSVIQLEERRKLSPQEWISKFGIYAILILVFILPFAVPAIYDALALRMSWSRIYYLPTPTENQWFMLQFGILWILIPYVAARIMFPPLSWERNGLTWLALIFGLCHIGSSLLAANPQFAFKSAIPMLTCILLFCAVGTMGLSKKDIEKVPLVAVLTMLPVGLYALAQSRGWDFLPYVPWGKTEGDIAIASNEGKQAIAATFGHPNYMGAYMAPLVFWAFYFTLSPARHKVLRILCVVIALLMLIAMVVGGTRGPLLGLAIGFAVFYMGLTSVPSLRRPVLFFGVLGILLTAAVLFIPNPFVKINFSIIDRLLGSKEIASRFYYWLISLEMFKDAPLFGLGAGGYNLYFWEFVQQFQASPNGPQYDFVVSDVLIGINPGFAHNDYLQILAEGGICSALVFLGIWAVIFSQCIKGCMMALRRSDSMSAILCVTFLASFVTVSVDCLFNFSFHIPVSLGWFWILAGIWVVYYHREQKISVSETQSS